MVIAGPGSGKTKCLTCRIAYLVQQGIDPANILAVTFTNKAAAEIGTRVRKILPNIKRTPSIGTFHSICLRILKADIDKFPPKSPFNGYKKNFTIYDQEDQLSLLKKTAANLSLSPDQFKPSIIQTIISRAKDELIDAYAYQEQANEYFPKSVARIYQKYQETLKHNQALDFDDLIMITAKLFEQNKEILEKYQNLWHYILVDEAHDVNASQYRLTGLLAQKNKNIWCISDVDQNIYSWRGADFRHVLNFEKDYPEAQVIFLEQNYRSSKNILEAAHNVIIKNQERKDKNLWTENTDGELINIIRAENEESEGEFLAEEIHDLVRQGRQLKDLVVLYRTNAQSRAIEEALIKAEIPYKLVGAIRFYERKEIKDIIAYLKFIHNPLDLVSFQRIINTPNRKLARFVKAEQIPDLAGPVFKDFNYIIEQGQEKCRANNLSELIKFILIQTHYRDYLKNQAKNQEDEQKRWENIQELITVAQKYDQTETQDRIGEFLEQTALLAGQDEIKNGQNMINLMTLHCAKGLEFPVVFMTGMEEGILPHSRSVFEPSQTEEERRLCYVGITRAKEKLYLTFTNQRRIFGQTTANLPSRFLGDIPEEIIEFREYS